MLICKSCQSGRGSKKAKLSIEVSFRFMVALRRLSMRLSLLWSCAVDRSGVSEPQFSGAASAGIGRDGSGRHRKRKKRQA